MWRSLVRDFAFRVLRQNRRVVTDESRRAELELFHEVLTDISMCRSTQSVRDFIIAAYVRGASTGNAEHTALEGNTAVFTKRRYPAVLLVRFVISSVGFAKRP